jgi:D-3-phosphoglycerate dehydrogenase
VPHIVVGGPLHPSGRAILDHAADVTVTYIAETSEPSLAAEIAGADGVLLRTQTVTEPTVALGRNVQIYSRHGVGYDAVDVDALSKRGIALAICGDVNASTVAEHAAMLILSASKRLMRSDSCVRTGPWEWRNQLEARDIKGQNLLQIGFGRIGQRIAGIMQAFGMSVRGYDPLLMQRGWPAGDVLGFEALDDALGWADVISLSVPHTEKPLLGAAEFAQMRDGVVLVNTARGGLIDEPALLAALESDKVGAAGLDVFAQEPMPTGHPLAQYDQVILTPHIAGLTRDAAERMAISSAENILNFFAGTIDPALIVNREHVNVPRKT